MIVLGSLLFAQSAQGTACTSLDAPLMNGGRWCLPSSINIKVYRGKGLNPCGPTDVQCTNRRLMIQSAVEAWNTALMDQVTSRVHLELLNDIVDETCTPPCIVITYSNYGLPKSARTKYSPAPFLNGWMDFSAIPLKVQIDNDPQLPADEWPTVLLHELGHALGLGHDCAGLMNEDYSGAAEVADREKRTIRCIYGTPLCPNPNVGCTSNQCYQVGLDTDMVAPSTVRHLLTACRCDPCSGTSPELLAGETAGTRTYRFAISEQGGPFMEYELLTEAEISDGVFTHTFGQSFTEAIMRLRVYDGDSLVAETYSTEPVSIVGMVDVPHPSADEIGSAFRATPNPFRGSVEFRVNVSSSAVIELRIYDVTGRHIATPFAGQALVGRHRLVWDGAIFGGGRARPGVYRAVMQQGNDTESTSIIKID